MRIRTHRIRNRLNRAITLPLLSATVLFAAALLCHPAFAQANNAAAQQQDAGSAQASSASDATKAAADAGDSASTDGDAATTADDTVYAHIYYYVLINDEWTLVNTDGTVYEGDASAYTPGDVTDRDPSWGGGKARLYVTGDVLEQVYGGFGFTADDLYGWRGKDAAANKTGSSNANKGSLIFANTTTDARNAGTIWADVEPWYDGGAIDASASPKTEGKYWHVPLRMDRVEDQGKDCAVYYLPGNNYTDSGTGDAFFNSNKSVDDLQMRKANSFYTVDVRDDNHDIYAEGEDVPAAQRGIVGSTVSITVRTDMNANVRWSVVNANTELPYSADYTCVDNKNGTLTFTFENISEPALITTEAEIFDNFDVTYTANTVTESLPSFGDFTDPKQFTLISDGKVKGGDTYEQVLAFSDAEAGATIDVPSLDKDWAEAKYKARYNKGADRSVLFTFAGWIIRGTNIVIEPGEKLDFEMLKGYALAGGKIYLDASWSYADKNNRCNTANFYININCEIADNESTGAGSGDTSMDSFTEAIYATRLWGTDDLPVDYHAQKPLNMTLIQAESDESAYTADRAIRASATDGQDINGVSLDSFPSDEAVLATIRAKKQAAIDEGTTDPKYEVKYEGVSVPLDELTTENFTVRWYVVKYEQSDGWHIDGVLVAKAAKMDVTKTFEGDSEAIAQIKSDANDYAIEVSHEDADHGSVVDYRLVFKPADDASLKTADAQAKRLTGYSSYDEATDTYHWNLAARRGRTYTMREVNYTIDDVTVTSTSWYNIANPSDGTLGIDAGASSTGWKEYAADETVDGGKTGAGIRIVADSYATDVPETAVQTVEFRNGYMQPGILAVQKVDYDTGHALAGVNFTVTRADGAEVTLWRKPGTNVYAADASLMDEGFTEKVGTGENAVVTSDDASGMFYIKLLANTTYYLVENIPTGYEGASRVSVQVDGDGVVKSTAADAAVDDVLPPDEGWVSGQGTAQLLVRNRSKRLLTMYVNKQWAATSATKQVTVQLWRNGAPVTDAAGKVLEMVLAADNGWSGSWQSLPLFADGDVAEYSLREVWIGASGSGGVSYDPAADPSDGYADYLVTYDKVLYREGDAGDWGTEAYWREGATEHFANEAMLTVHNASILGQISFTKKDREGNDGLPLAGATFALFTDEACANAVVDADGNPVTATSDTSGFVEFGERPVGTYYIKETKAPAGYRTTDTVLRAVVSGGNVTITHVGDSSQAPVGTVENKLGAVLKIKKMAEGGKLVEGATFTISKQGSDGTYRTFTTVTTPNDGTGTAWVLGLTQGAYRVEETGAPAGYETPEGSQFFFTVSNVDGRVSMQVDPDHADYDSRVFTEFTVDTDTDATGAADASTLTGNLTVVNKALATMPTAGGAGTLLFTAVAVFLMAVAAGIWFRARRGGLHA